MGKVKELVRQCWAHWYVRTTAWVAITGLSVLVFLVTTQVDTSSYRSFRPAGRGSKSGYDYYLLNHDYEYYREHHGESQDVMRQEEKDRKRFLELRGKDQQFRQDVDLCSALLKVEDFCEGLPYFVSLPVVAVGFISFSLDAGYKWLRKRIV